MDSSWPRFKEDFRRYYAVPINNARSLRYLQLFRTPGLHAVATYRFARWTLGRSKLTRVFLTPLAVYLQRRMRIKWGIEISHHADIGPGFQVVHYGGVFLPWDLVAGANLTIMHDVTMGVAYGKKQGSPTIGDNVTIGPGAKILGKIRIGNNVRIGPNAVITRNVPDNCVVQLEAPRVIQFPGTYLQKQNDGS